MSVLNKTLFRITNWLKILSFCVPIATYQLHVSCISHSYAVHRYLKLQSIFPAWFRDKKFFITLSMTWVFKFIVYESTWNNPLNNVNSFFFFIKYFHQNSNTRIFLNLLFVINLIKNFEKYFNLEFLILRRTFIVFTIC